MSRGDHDGQAEDVSRYRESEVAGIVAGEGGKERRDPIERGDVQRQSRHGEHAHGPLDDAQRAQGILQPVNPRPDPPGAKGKAEDERRQHELERVSGAPQHQSQHADPIDLVNE
jgi:hypothetical protein